MIGSLLHAVFVGIIALASCATVGQIARQVHQGSGMKKALVTGTNENIFYIEYR